ncbi:MAG: hypothetical protein IKB34_06135 [Clostridia bacterium]|nr:hypothetical protein [Clostridia bacterium]
MKACFKLICILTLLCTVATAVLSGCGGSGTVSGKDNTSGIKVDVDYSRYSDTMLYDAMQKFASDSDLLGKTVKIRAEYGGVFDFTKNTYINVIEQFDATACCAAYYQLKLGEGVEKPHIGSEIEIVGTFEKGYINVSALTLVKGNFDTTKVDVDAANMSRDDLTAFLDTIKLPNNEYKGKTVRICGHYAKSKDGFHYLVGYESSLMSNQLTSTWSFEIHSDSVEFPEINDNYIYAYEIIGTVSTYTVDNGTWPCIEIISFRPITTYNV